MKKITIIFILLSCSLFLGVGSATAATTGILPGPETPLIGAGGILDQLYGWGNLQRVDDFGVLPNDQVWFNPGTGTGSATAQAKYADYNQDFGYIPDGGSFVSLFPVTGNGINLGAPTADLASGPYNFVWALDPSGASQWTSKQSLNSDSEFDHMVTWLIKGNADNPNNPVGSYVIAWEDLPGGGDHDYNDLVVEVNVAPVPIPAAILLLGSGLIGLAGIRKKFKR
jgi:hypothetical protein